MKKLLLSVILFISLGITAWGQAPQQFNYQGVARSASGTPLVSTVLGLRFTIREGSATGSIDYQETQSTSTNTFGLYNVFIGAGTTTSLSPGAFSTVAWGSGPKFLVVEIDPLGATNYTTAGTAQLLSVPYALYAANTGVTSITAGTGLNGGTITNTGTISMPPVGTAGTYGSGTTVPVITTDPEGRVTAVTNTLITAGAGTVTSINSGAGLTGGPITSSGTLSLAPVGSAGTYGTGGLTVPVITTDAYGRVTSVGSTPIIAAGTGTVTSVTAGAGLSGGTITSVGTVSMPAVGVPGTYGSATGIPEITTDPFGRVTGVTVNPVPAGITSTGTANYIAKFTSPTAIANSGMYQSSTHVGLNTITPAATLEVSGGTDYNAISAYNTGSTPSDSGVILGEYRGTATGLFPSSAGVMGIAEPDLTIQTGIGVKGQGGFVGVVGVGETQSFTPGASQATGVEGDSYSDGDYSIGILANANSMFFGPNIEYGIYAQTDGFGFTNFAGEFQGDVDISGTLTATTKLFKMDDPLDPENKYLYHGCVESNELMNIYTGNVTTDASGIATVTFPAYMEALNKDFRYQLTVIGTFAQAIVSKEMSGNQFEIKTNIPNVKVSWQITGVRHDPYANAHPLIVEKDKAPRDKGKYVNAVEYGKPVEMNIGRVTTQKRGTQKPGATQK